MAGASILAALGEIAIGFVPPSQLSSDSLPLLFAGGLLVAIMILALPPQIIYAFRRPSWSPQSRNSWISPECSPKRGGRFGPLRRRMDLPAAAAAETNRSARLDGRFRTLLRMYQAKQPILDGSYLLPAIRRVE